MTNKSFLLGAAAGILTSVGALSLIGGEIMQAAFMAVGVLLVAAIDSRKQTA